MSGHIEAVVATIHPCTLIRYSCPFQYPGEALNIFMLGHPWFVKYDARLKGIYVMNSPYSLSRLPFNLPSRAGNLASQVERLVGDILQGPASLPKYSRLWDGVITRPLRCKSSDPQTLIAL